MRAEICSWVISKFKVFSLVRLILRYRVRTIIPMLGLVNYAKDPLSVEIRELPVPEIGEEDVLFKVQAVGICGSDLHQYTGKQSWKVNYPVVLGHEFAGSIARLGSRV